LLGLHEIVELASDILPDFFGNVDKIPLSSAF
jgi:hypothetical protein